MRKRHFALQEVEREFFAHFVKHSFLLKNTSKRKIT